MNASPHHRWSLPVVLACLALSVSAAVEGDPYRAAVVAYADAMIEHGRDRYGAVNSPLFAAALDRETLRIGSFPAIDGVREHDRSQTGSNPQYDQALYAICYRLSELGYGPRYAAEADAALTWLFAHCQSEATGLLAWGEHIFWDFETEAMAGRDTAHELKGAWPFWPRCIALAPDASWRFIIGLWDHQVADHDTGDFSRHARWSAHGPQRGTEFPRYAGQMILCWTAAYAHPAYAEQPRRDDLLRACRVILERMEANRASTESGHLRAGTDAKHRHIAWPSSNLELARCLWIAAERVPDQLAARMRRVALDQDRDFLRIPHAITGDGGFVATIDVRSGEPRSREMNLPYTSDWSRGYGYGIHAGVAGKCAARMRQLAGVEDELVAGYRPLVLAAADRYLATGPDEAELLKPGTLAQVIELLLDAAELSGEARYRDRAAVIADQAMALFLDDASALPKATQRHDHYESITGGPGLMAALLRLSEALAAVR